jgi:hypothetical protein
MRLTWTTVLLGILLSASPSVAAELTWPQPGSETPGALSYLYNVTGLELYRDRFHCLVTDYGLDPTIMVVIRGADQLENPAVQKMLQELDSTVNSNVVKRLHAFVVILDPSVKNVVKDDVPRYLLSKKKLATFAKDKLNGGERLPLCISTEEQMPNYPLDKDAVITIVFYKDHRVVESKTFDKDLKEEDAINTVKDGAAKILPAK